MVGLPGVGKTTVARRILSAWQDGCVELEPLSSPWRSVEGRGRRGLHLLRLLAGRPDAATALARYHLEGGRPTLGAVRAYLERVEWHRKLSRGAGPAFLDEGVAQSLFSLSLGGRLPSVEVMRSLLRPALGEGDTLLLLDLSPSMVLDRLRTRGDGPSRLDRLPEPGARQALEQAAGFLPRLALAAQSLGARCVWLDGEAGQTALAARIRAVVGPVERIDVRIQQG